MVVTCLPGDRRHRRDAGRARRAVDVDRAGAAERHPAAVLGAGQPERLPDRPEERHVRGHVELAGRAVHRERDHAASFRPSVEPGLPVDGVRRGGPGDPISSRSVTLSVIYAFRFLSKWARHRFQPSAAAAAL